jgi:hypothetical protein
MELCQLNEHARKLFNKDGRPIKSADDIADQETLYVSTGEPFGFGVTSAGKPKKAAAPTSPKPPDAPKKEPLDETAGKTPKSRKERIKAEILSFNRMVAASSRPQEEAIKESTASVYATLDRPQQRKLPDIVPMHDDCQQMLLMTHLLRLSICPHHAEPLPESTRFAQNAFHHVATSEIRFVIGGPRQSGKTTLLYQLASVLCRKLQLSDEVSTFLLFPVNFELISFAVGDVVQLLHLFIATAFDAVEYSALRLLPWLGGLRKWFLACIFGAAIAPPQDLVASGFFNVQSLVRITKDLRRALKEDGDHSLREFVELACAFPNSFARAVGLKGAIFIIDAFELTQVSISPSPGFFPRSLEGVCLSDTLSGELNRSSFLVSMRDEQRFFECFACEDAAFIGTQGIVSVPDRDDDEIWVHDAFIPIEENPGLRLRESECLGCPGFITLFRRVAQLSTQIAKNTAIPSAWAHIRVAPDIARQKVIKFELLRLLQLLADAPAPNVDITLVARVQASKALAVKLITAEERLQGTNGTREARKTGIDIQVSGLLPTNPPRPTK